MWTRIRKLAKTHRNALLRLAILLVASSVDIFQCDAVTERKSCHLDGYAKTQEMIFARPRPVFTCVEVAICKTCKITHRSI
jgi:hypothetical protein